MTHSRPLDLVEDRYGLAGDLTVARLGFGAMQLPGPGVWGWPEDPAGAVRVLRRAFELGVDHVDTSDAYGPHVANELIREALVDRPDGIVVATKVGAVRDATGGFVSAAAPSDLRQQVQENLQRLAREQLDLVYLRVGGDGLLPPSETPIVESFGALREIQERGHIRCLGLSGVTLEQLRTASRIAPVAAVQNRYHLFDRASEGVLAACEETGTAFVPYFPLAAGLLTPSLDLSQVPPAMRPPQRLLSLLDEIAKRHEASRIQVAIAWLLARSPVLLVIPGTSSVSHLEENLAAHELVLDTADKAALDAIGPDQENDRSGR